MTVRDHNKGSVKAVRKKDELGEGKNVKPII